MAKIYFRKKLIGIKAEVSYGVEAGTVGAGLAHIKVRDVNIDPFSAEELMLEEDTGELGSDLSTMVGKQVMLSFKFRMSGSGTAGLAPATGPIIVACGHTQALVALTSADYTPDDEALGSVTIYFWRDKVLHKMLGARGSLKAAAAKRQYGYFEASMKALYIGPVATTLPTPTFTLQVKPVPFNKANVNCSVAGVVVGLHEISHDFGQKMEMYEHSEEESIQQEDRKPRFEALIEEPELGTLDIYAMVNNETTGTKSFVLGTVAGNIVEIAATLTQIVGPIKVENVQGISALRIQGPMAKNGAVPDYTISFR